MNRRVVPVVVSAALIAMASGCDSGERQAVRSTSRTSMSVDHRPAVDADPRCVSQSAANAVVIASFETTIGDLRRWLDRGEVKVGAGRWAGRADRDAVLLCWYDGPIAKSPPPPASGGTPPLFNRYATFIDGTGEPALVIAGYGDRLAPEAPHE